MQNEVSNKHIHHSLKNSKLYDVVVTDLLGNCTYVNETFKSRFSFISEEFIGKPAGYSTHPEDVLKMKEIFKSCLANPKDCYPLELRKPLRSGKGYNWTQWEFSALVDDKHSPCGILCVGFDITAPQHNNLKFKESQDKLKKTFEVIPHSILILDANSTIKFVNSEFESTFGYLFDEVFDENVQILFPRDRKQKFKKLLEYYIKNSEEQLRVDQYFNFETRANETITVGVSLNSFYDNDDLNFIVILEDLTIAKQHQDTIINQNRVLKKIAWKHSHEIRKPVANILGLSNLFNLEDIQSETNYKTISYMIEAANELDQITQTIVKEANKHEYQIEFKKHKRYLF